MRKAPRSGRGHALLVVADFKKKFQTYLDQWNHWQALPVKGNDSRLQEGRKTNCTTALGAALSSLHD
jgi:hypothetical protein